MPSKSNHSPPDLRGRFARPRGRAPPQRPRFRTRSALLSLSKDARVSKDGHRRDRACSHPSRRPREERGLLRMRSEGLIASVRYDGFHGIDPLDIIATFSQWANLALKETLGDETEEIARRL